MVPLASGHLQRQQHDKPHIAIGKQHTRRKKAVVCHNASLLRASRQVVAIGKQALGRPPTNPQYLLARAAHQHVAPRVAIGARLQVVSYLRHVSLCRQHLRAQLAAILRGEVVQPQSGLLLGRAEQHVRREPLREGALGRGLAIWGGGCSGLHVYSGIPTRTALPTADSAGQHIGANAHLWASWTRDNAATLLAWGTPAALIELRLC